MSSQVVKGFNVSGSTVQYDYESLADRILKSSIANEYNPLDTYKVDDYVLYAGQLYRCIVEITTPQNFDSFKWEAVSAGSDLKWLKKYYSINDEIKQAILNCFAHCAWTDEHGQEYYNELEAELFRTTDLDYITALFTQGSAVVYDTDSLDSLRQYLTVTAYYEDGTEGVVTTYTLRGTLEVGTSTITVSYGKKTATFDVTVTQDYRYILFGELRTGVAITKSSSTGVTYLVNANPEYAGGRAVVAVPIVNRNFVITSTNPEKYGIVVAGITDPVAKTTSVPSDAVDGCWYQGDNKNISWNLPKGVSTAEYIWIGLRKMDNTDFTEAELAHGGEAIFNYTMDGVGLDSTAYGDLTYRDIFITNNVVGWYGDFESNFTVSTTETYKEATIPYYNYYKLSPNTVGNPSVSTSQYDSLHHSLNISSDGQSRYMYGCSYDLENKSLWGKAFIVAFSCNIPSYTSGKVEFQIFGATSTVIRAIRDSATNGWEPVLIIGTPEHPNNVNYLNMNFGSLGNATIGAANFTGYMDDLVVTPLPDGMTEQQALTLFNNYCKIRRGEVVEEE